MAQVIAVAVQEGGMPVPRGGGARLADALVRLIEDNGGTCRTGAEVESVVVRDGARRRRAHRRRRDGRGRAGRDRERDADPALRPAARQPAGRRSPQAGRRFRYGRSEMQIHFALSEPPRWDGDERLARTAVVHVTPGLDGVSRAVNEAERGLLPAEPTVVCGQPLTIDPSRAPDGKGMLWIQLQELPWHVKGDAAGELDTGDGTWTDELRERYADRVQARLARHIPNLEVGGARARDALPRRPAGGEPEPRPRRPVRGLARARPELRLAAVPRPARSPHARSTGSGTSARARGPGPGLGAGSGRSSPRSCCGRRRARGCSGGCPASAAPEEVARGAERCGKIARVGRGEADAIRRGQFIERGLALPSPASVPRFSRSQISTPR